MSRSTGISHFLRFICVWGQFNNPGFVQLVCIRSPTFHFVFTFWSLQNMSSSWLASLISIILNEKSCVAFCLSGNVFLYSKYSFQWTLLIMPTGTKWLIQYQALERKDRKSLDSQRDPDKAQLCSGITLNSIWSCWKYHHVGNC